MVTNNNQIPYVVGAQYCLTPGTASSDWVTITQIGGKLLFIAGLDDNTASFKIPTWKFDDLVVEYKIDGVLYSKEDGLYELLTNDGAVILF